jgi:hypothetical protein
MFEKLLPVVKDPSLLTWLLLIAVVAIAWLVFIYLKSRRLTRILEALLASLEKPFLFYDREDKLIYHTTGLIIFDKQGTESIRKLGKRPQPGQELKGEIEIDGNTYRFRSNLIEYRPESFGTLILLEYRNGRVADK